MFKEYKIRKSCAICYNQFLKNIINFGEISLAGNFPTEDQIDTCKRYPLNLLYCDKCHLVQTDSIIDSDFLFKDYRYMSSIGLSSHFNSVADMYQKRFNLTNTSKLLEIGSNDGVLLKPLTDRGVDCVGFDPSKNISEVAIKKGCKVINDYFSLEAAKTYLSESSFDIICSNNCFAHIEDIHSILDGVNYCLKPDGTFIIEVHYLKNLIEDNQYDFIYHEHLYYYSLSSLNYLFNLHGLTIIDCEEIPIHSGSIRVYASKHNSFNKKVTKRLEFENAIGMTSYEYFEDFKRRVSDHIESLKFTIKNLKNKGFKIAGYGASGRGNVLLNMCNLSADDISFVIDESPERYNRYIGGTNIPIFNKNYLLSNTPDYFLILAWNYKNDIIRKLYPNFTRFIIPFPQIYIIE